MLSLAQYSACLFTCISLSVLLRCGHWSSTESLSELSLTVTLPVMSLVLLAVSATGARLKGEPIQIVVATDEHTFELDEAVLEDILLQPGVCNKKVAIISVAGAFRKGKSFLLDFFLRYLSANVSSLSLVSVMFVVNFDTTRVYCTCVCVCMIQYICHFLLFVSEACKARCAHPAWERYHAIKIYLLLLLLLL